MKPIYIQENLDLEMMYGGRGVLDTLIEKLFKNDVNKDSLKKEVSKLSYKTKFTLVKILFSIARKSKNGKKNEELNEIIEDNKNTIRNLIKNINKDVVLNILHYIYINIKFEKKYRDIRPTLKYILDKLNIYTHFRVKNFEKFEKMIENKNPSTKSVNFEDEFMRLEMDIEKELRLIREYVEIINKSLY